MKYIILVLVFVLFGCGKNNLPINANKGLFSTWTSTDTSSMDFSLGKLSTAFAMTNTAINKQQCSCNATFIGTEANGTFTFSSCTFVASSGGSDPGCSTLNMQGTYANSSATMNLCVTNPGPTVCAVYR